MKSELPVWRSLMYVPVNVEKYVDTAHTRGADAIQLRSGGPHSACGKGARTLVEKAAARVKRGGADVIVRINRPLAVRDFAALIAAELTKYAKLVKDTGVKID